MAAGWSDAFRVLASVLPDSPTIIVLDELPWLAEQDETFDGALQTAWDRLLSRRRNIAAEAGSRSGAVPSGTLTPILHRLVEDKHVLAVDEPLSVRATKPALYRVADTSLRFYLAIGRSAHELSRRGRAAPAAELIKRRWASWRGRAVEPIIQEALSVAAADLPWPEAVAVGGWWNRAFDPEIDLVGGDRTPVASKLFYTGSIKWLDRPFGAPDLAALQRSAPQIPGFDPGQTAPIGVSRAGFTDVATTSLALCWLPRDVIDAFTSATSATVSPG